MQGGMTENHHCTIPSVHGWLQDQAQPAQAHSRGQYSSILLLHIQVSLCLLYTSDAADELLCVDLGGRRTIEKKKKFIHIFRRISTSTRIKAIVLDYNILIEKHADKPIKSFTHSQSMSL